MTPFSGPDVPTLRPSKSSGDPPPESWEPLDHLERSLGPSGRETPKKSEQSLPESLEKFSKNSGKKSRKGPEKTFSRLSPESRGTPGPEGLGDFFQTFSGFRARRAEPHKPQFESLFRTGAPMRATVLYANKAETEMHHFCLKHSKTRHTLAKQERTLPAFP